MARLIDTSIVVDLDRRGFPFGVLIAEAPDEPMALAAVSASELFVGVHRTTPAERRRKRAAYVEAVIEALPVFPFDLRVARVHARLLARLLDAGQPIGVNDLQIAATALVHGYEILTLNVRDFERVPGLVVRRPSW